MNELAHLGAGILIAGAFGFRGWRQVALGLFAIFPDWDALTTPLIPWLLGALDLSRADGHQLVVALGHGAFSHSILGMLGLLGIGFAFGLRGRALACAATALASHWLLDVAVPWDVWFLLPFSEVGYSLGWLALDDPVVSLALGGLALASLAPHAYARLRHRSAAEAPRWLAPALVAVAALVVLAPIVSQQAVAAREPDDARVLAVGYMTFVVVDTEEDELRLALLRAPGGVIEETRVLASEDQTGGRATEELLLARRALSDMGPLNPFTVAVLTARAEDDRIIVEARDAREVIASKHLQVDELGMEFVFAAGPAVEELRLTKGGREVPAPLEALPLWVPLARDEA